MQNHIEMTECRVCNNDKLEPVLDLNTQPLANNYHSGEVQEQYPLSINVCTECFHVQLSVVVNPDLMFKKYLYVSGTSITLRQYFADFVDLCQNYTPKDKKNKVLDIACNDGTQLDAFKEKGWDTYGVDPAENLYELSSENHNVACDYWNERVAKMFNKTFDTIVAQNVFAHTHDIHGFLQACQHVTDEESTIFIQTSQADMIINNEFDTIYHEHLSFFNSKSMKKCANLNGFSLISVLKTEIHGGSNVFVLKKGTHNEEQAETQIEKERKLGLYDLETYVEYAKRCQLVADSFSKEIDNFKKEGYKVVGYGAAAKGNTFLNFSQVDLDYIVDDNDLKWELLTPGRNIPIKDPQYLKKENPNKIVVVPLAWNFFHEIRVKTENRLGRKIKFIKYFPSIEIV